MILAKSIYQPPPSVVEIDGYVDHGLGPRAIPAHVAAWANGTVTVRAIAGHIYGRHMDQADRYTRERCEDLLNGGEAMFDTRAWLLQLHETYHAGRL